LCAARTCRSVAIVRAPAAYGRASPPAQSRIDKHGLSCAFHSRSHSSSFRAEASFAALWQRETRWLRTIRSANRAGFAFLFITFGFPWIAAGAALALIDDASPFSIPPLAASCRGRERRKQTVAGSVPIRRNPRRWARGLSEELRSSRLCPKTPPIPIFRKSCPAYDPEIYVRRHFQRRVQGRHDPPHVLHQT
jgi:hypothetical protein